MDKQSPKLPKTLVSVAFAVIILCWGAFIVQTLITQEPDIDQMLIMLIMSVLVAWLVVTNNPQEYDIDSEADAKAEGSTPSSVISQAKTNDKDNQNSESVDKRQENPSGNDDPNGEDRANVNDD